MEDRIQTLRNYAMGSLIKKYAANKMFFTNEEFEKHKGEILIVGGALHRIEMEILKNK